METRIRRYFTLRKINSNLQHTDHTTDELDLVSIPYDSTPNGRAPVLSFGPRRREMIRTKDDLDVLAIRAFPYASAVAGTPPIFGATPIKGNGPVKLQTSRRLSSGELLTTTQNHERTLSDIREGEYIVGRKEPKSISRTVSLKRARHSEAASPRPSLAPAPQISSPTSEQNPSPKPKVIRNHVPDPINIHKDLEAVAVLAPQSPPCSPYSRKSSATKASVPGPTEVPLPSSPAKPPSSRTSLLSRGEEQNATIQALWKAEYARLVAIYGQDGVDRNIAELNKDHFATPREKRSSLDTSTSKLSTACEAMPLPSLDIFNPPLVRSARGSVAQEPPLVDNASDYSSIKVPSLLSSEESSSSYTKRTSLFEADVPTTREEVSRIVENMRKNYLRALDKAEEKPKAKRPKRMKQRASYTHTSTPAASAPLGISKEGRQTWHASTVPSTPTHEKHEKQPQKRSITRSKTPRESAIGQPKKASSKSSLKGKPQLHRADSTTLGSFFGARKDDTNSPSPARTLRVSKSEISQRKDHLDGGQPPSTGSASSRCSSDTTAPEIDDFDIFYQDLALNSGGASSTVKHAVPAIYFPYNEETSTAKHYDAAPPPPDIDWTPRKGAAVRALP